MSEPRDQCFEEAVSSFFATHAEDPRTVEKEGRRTPYALLYHERMKAWLRKIAPEASEELRLAVCCQHLRRWEIPRSRYPEGKLGYKKWRHDLAVFHGNEAEKVLRVAGYGDGTVERVKQLLLKKGLKTDPDVQALEDVVCLVFLETEFADFAAKHEEEKITTILRKTWLKMSQRGHREALDLVSGLPEELQSLIGRALGRQES